MIFKGHKLTIGVDLGDRWSCYCVLDETGEILLDQKVATTPEAMKQELAGRTYRLITWVFTVARLGFVATFKIEGDEVWSS